ncbi:MAG: Pr6Pr family membrane protein [Eubacteriales bacterium]|nr:Pr6Pr family membrane protein [Eubacteriales bacterium]
MHAKRNLCMGLCINLTIFCFEVIGLVQSIQDQGWGLFQYYTIDSNILAMLACGWMAVCQLLCIIGKKAEIAPWVFRFKYLSVCMLSVTFLVVVLVLAPWAGMGGYQAMLFHGTMLYHHFLCPVLAFLSFIFLEAKGRIRKKDIRIALLPTLLYAITAVILNMVHVMNGPYPFLKVYEQPVPLSILWFIVILTGAYAIAWLVRLLSGNAPGRNHRRQA